VNVSKIMEECDFVTEVEFPSGLCKFTHPQLTVEFLTNPGAKPGEEAKRFKQLGITAQELRYMSIALSYRQKVEYRDIEVALPEPEAFTLHKLIVCCLRRNPEKAQKDRETARGMLEFFGGKEQHIARIREIYAELPKGWRKRVDDGLESIGMHLP
jgi:hypothetical protein